ncbi:MAG: Abi-alpha family protein [Thermodesulfobacteriota bacterium]
MNDESRAIEEVAKASGKGIDAARELGGFLSKYAGGSLKQAMGIVEDKLKYLRWERQVRLMQRANEFLAERGLRLPSRKVPLRIAIPLIQCGSLEENDSLQDRWAALLTNAADGSSDTEVRRAFISILEDLTPLDAVLLEKIYEATVVPDVEAELWTTFLPDRVTHTKPELENLRPPNEVEISLGNLARLGLITTALAWGGFAIFSCVHRTVLGREFLRSVTRAKTNS